MKTNKLLSIACASLLSTNVMALDASSLKLSVYSIMVSTSSQCTSPVTLFSNTVPTEVDFLSTPTLGSGNPADATYNCVIIKMSDIIKYTPSSSSGSCTGGIEYSADICRADNSGTTLGPDATSSPTVCTGNSSTPSADIVYLYLTTNSTAGTGGIPFCSHPILLAPMV